MAETSQEPQTAISKLRAQAQANLTEIEAELMQEEAQEAQAQRDIQRFMKTRNPPAVNSRQRKSRSPDVDVRLAASEEEMGSSKGPRFRTAQDVLDRLRWDEAFDISQYRVGYLERFEGIKEMAVSSWIGDFTDEEWIPQHRIKYVKQRVDGEWEIVWDREARIDKIFGSGKGNAMEEDLKSDVFSIDGSSVTGGANLH